MQRFLALRNSPSQQREERGVKTGSLSPGYDPAYGINMFTITQSFERSIICCKQSYSLNETEYFRSRVGIWSDPIQRGDGGKQRAAAGPERGDWRQHASMRTRSAQCSSSVSLPRVSQLRTFDWHIICGRRFHSLIDSSSKGLHSL